MHHVNQTTSASATTDFSTTKHLTWKQLLKPRSMAFYAVHLAALGAIWTGIRPLDIAICLGLFWVRMFAITGAYHRYFAHRTYKTSRAFQFVLAFLGASAAQKGPLWWAGNHRDHHRYSDTDKDVHSPWYGGFFWSHVGWILSGDYEEIPYKNIGDFAKYPELRWLDRHVILPPFALGLATFLVGGWSALWIGFFLSTALLYHSTFTINSFMHRWGSQRYRTGDTSRNTLTFALLTLGEGWHNNHHYYQSSCRQGFYWWEIDVTYYVLKALSWVGLVWDIKSVPRAVREANHYAAGEPRLLRIDGAAIRAAAQRAIETARDTAAGAAAILAPEQAGAAMAASQG